MGWWGVGSGWWVAHGGEAVSVGMPAFAIFLAVGGDTPICVKSLFLRFLKAPVTTKVKQAEAK